MIATNPDRKRQKPKTHKLKVQYTQKTHYCNNKIHWHNKAITQNCNLTRKIQKPQKKDNAPIECYMYSMYSMYTEPVYNNQNELAASSQKQPKNEKTKTNESTATE